MKSFKMNSPLIYITGVIFLFAAFAFAADKPAAESNKGNALKPISVKTATMNARGKVVEISDTTIKIARSIKGDVEIMEFALENPAKDIQVNDSVKIDYSIKDGKLTASRVVKPGTFKNAGNFGIKPIKEKPASVTK